MGDIKKYISILSVLILFFSSCVPSSGGKKREKKSTDLAQTSGQTLIDDDAEIFNKYSNGGTLDLSL
ncbi:MAG: hypothetical protein H6622_05395 [Halobacteriovoraceae bacterium]|nr:hypothetical protein [Halobacteriovoraceae bacterium]